MKNKIKYKIIESVISIKFPFKNDIRFFNLLWQCSPVWSTNTGILMTIIEKDVKLSHIKLKIEN